MARVELRISGIDEAEEKLRLARESLGNAQSDLNLVQLAINAARVALHGAVFTAVSLPEDADAESQERA